MRSKFKWIFTLLLALSLQLTFAQEKTITGVVSDATGPLPGANVVVKGTKRGVQTDVDGKYAIKAKAGEVLLFSFIGMKDATATIGASSSVNMVMKDAGVTLGEVVVTGQGIKKEKKALGYAVTTIKSEEFASKPSTDIARALTGKAPGVNIQQTSGLSGSGTNIIIRGYSSITGSSPKGRSKNYPKYSCPRCRTKDTGKQVSEDRDFLHKEFEALLETISPSADSVILMKNILVRRWNNDNRTSLERKNKLGHRIQELNQKRQKILDLFIDSRLTEDEKNDSLERISIERTNLNLELNAINEDTMDSEVVVEYALNFMQNLPKLWRDADGINRIRFQTSIFPDGIRYDFGKGFRTIKLGLSYGLIRDLRSDESTLVGLSSTYWNHIKAELVNIYLYSSAARPSTT